MCYTVEMLESLSFLSIAVGPQRRCVMRRHVLALLLPLVVAVGCADRRQSPVDDGEGEDTGGSDTNTGGGTTSSSGSATGSSGASTGGSSGSASDDGSGSATDDSSDSATGGSTGSGGHTGQIACGDSICDTAASEYCCDGQTCHPDDTPCRGLSIHCDTADDCPGEYCCTDLQPATIFECRTTCEGESQAIVCAHGEPDDCPEGLTCNITAQLPTAYGFCG
jgi:hypothetical protein